MIQKASLSRDDMGGTEYTWENEIEQWAYIEWKDGVSEGKNDTTSSRVAVEFTIQNVSEAQQGVSANAYRIAYPINMGVVIATKTQFYTITGIKLYGGREKYKTLITHLATDTKPTAI